MSDKMILTERIESKILLLRGKKVMLDRDLALLYGIDAKSLKRAVRRNIDRFPVDFMFVLDQQELTNWRRQFGTSKSDRLGLRYPPMAFTEPGVAMLSSVLNSQRAIQVNIAIMRAFIRLRQILATHSGLARELDELERKYDAQFRVVFTALRRLMNPPRRARRRIGFAVREKRSYYRARAASK
jgi:hypothetical protein